MTVGAVPLSAPHRSSAPRRAADGARAHSRAAPDGTIGPGPTASSRPHGLDPCERGRGASIDAVTGSSRARPVASVRDHVVYLAGVFCLTASIAGLWLGMRAVMNIGGYCASGGPYEIAVECPPGVDLVIILAVPVGILSAGIVAWRGSRLGRSWAGIAGLAWPVLFLSLGWNFLEYAVRPPDGSGGLVLGWLIPGVIFVLMGAFPLLILLRARRKAALLDRLPGPLPAASAGDAARPLRMARRAVEADPAGGVRGEVPMEQLRAPKGATGLTGHLERLARLHEEGALSADEYQEAKRAVIAAASRGELG